MAQINSYVNSESEVIMLSGPTSVEVVVVIR